MADTAYERITAAIERYGLTVRHRGSDTTAQCPAHDDLEPSLSIRDGNGQALLYCHAGCDTRDVVDRLELTMADLFDNPAGVTYTYDDGRQVHRTPDKKFRQSGNTAGSALYRLDQIREAVAAGKTVCVVEGEKDVHALETAGAVATCSAMGAGKARKFDWSPLAGADVRVIADNDIPGEKHAREVAAILNGLGARVTGWKASRGKDAADHIAAGYTLAELVPYDLGTVDLFGDVAALLNGDLPDLKSPTLCRRTDGRSLFYAADVNTLFGDSESGKTWVALAALAEALADGGSASFVDLDHNGMDQIVFRLVDLGAPVEALRDRDLFRYAEPQDSNDLLDVIAALVQWRPGWVVVDSIGEVLPMLGLSSNSPDDYTTANRQVLKPLASAGAGVIAIDHTPKNTETARQGATGTVAKKRSVSGVSLRVKINEQFTPGRGGSAWLSVNKDRHGGLRGACPPGREPTAGLFTLDASMRWEVKAPTLPGQSGPFDNPIDTLIAKLDELKVPQDAGRPTAEKALRGAGFRHAKDTLSRAIKLRKTHLTSCPSPFGQSSLGTLPETDSGSVRAVLTLDNENAGQATHVAARNALGQALGTGIARAALPDPYTGGVGQGQHAASVADDLDVWAELRDDS